VRVAWAWRGSSTYVHDFLIYVYAQLLQPKPGPYLAEIKDSVLYNGNRVIKEFKEK
jgi:hypothetical protein